MDKKEKELKELSERVKKLEKRLNDLLAGKVDLEVVEVKEVKISPRSKLRVACE